ncbi:cytochrome P450 CYP736A12-like [Apium graveolens]|uniref:cytochrome P450 CYP736A12-like n=1 Tax=Apium graveolens TaxID=4045 RepID=UPI003D7C0666
MILSLAFSFLFLFLGAAFWWILDAKQRKLLPPGPRGLPIVGSLLNLGSLPHRTFHELSKKYGPIMSLRMGSVPSIVVSSPEAAQLFLKTHDSAFAARPQMEAVAHMSYGNNGISFTNGTYWRHVRKFVVQELLAPAKVNSFRGMRRDEVGLVVEEIKKAAVAGEVVNVSDKVGGLIENMTFRFLLGRSKDDRFDLKGIMTEAFTLAEQFNLADFVPSLKPLDLQGLTRKYKETGKKLDAMLELIIEEHEQNLNTGTRTNNRDIVDEMISLSKNDSSVNHQELAKLIDRSSIKSIMIDIITAAIDTSFTSIEWILKELMRHPRAMKKCQEELTCVVGLDRLVEETDLPKLEYLYMVIKEGMRLHPIVPLLGPHEAKEDIVVNGYHIPQKSRIIVNAWAIGRDSKVWGNNALEFIPERFSESKIDLRGRDFELLLFGSGRRGCPGMQLGLLSVQLVLAQLLHCFDWELPHGKSAEDMDMTEQFGLTIPRIEHLLLVPKLRI